MWDGPPPLWTAAHTLSIDPERGWLYVHKVFPPGVGPGQGEMWAFDVSSFNPPNDPPQVMNPLPWRAHDSFSRRDRTYVALQEGGPSNPSGKSWELLDTAGAMPTPLGVLNPVWWTPAGDPHNVWVSEDELLIALTQESPTPAWGRVYIHRPLAVPIMNTPALISEYVSPNPGAGGAHVVHNVFGIGRTLYMAHYTDGFHMVDVADPANMPQLVAHFDTYTSDFNPAPWPFLPNNPCGLLAGRTTTSAYYGAYDCYPYQDSGLVYVTDTTNGLFVLDIDRGHFRREKDAFPTAAGSIPNVFPSGATPRCGASSFQFRLTGLTPGASYVFLLGTQPAQTPIGPLGQQIFEWVDRSSLIFLDSGDAVPANGEVLLPWECDFDPAPGTSPVLYANVWESMGSVYAGSKRIRFKLLP